jgi:hypothetical protein
MSTLTEDLDTPTPEEILAPPKYDAVGVAMVFITSLIVGIVAGIIVIVLAYLAIGNFSLESGASPILLAFITFIALTIGNILYYMILSKIFPNIYSHGRTAISQITTMSILLYILFIPIYLIVAGISTQTATILMAFSSHVAVNSFALTILIGLISQYRYTLLAFYAGLITLIFTSSIIVLVESQISSSSSTKALFSLLGLTILTFTLSGTLSSLISWIYYRSYQMSGYDPIGSIFSRIEEEEHELEKKAVQELTTFHK